MKNKSEKEKRKKYVMKAVRFTEAEWKEAETIMNNEGCDDFSPWVKKVIKERLRTQAAQREVAEFVKPLIRATGMPLKMLEE